MATSSIFADFSIRDKKTARAFVKALEEASKDPRPHPTTPFRYITDPEELKKRIAKFMEKGKH